MANKVLVQIKTQTRTESQRKAERRHVRATYTEKTQFTLGYVLLAYSLSLSLGYVRKSYIH